MKMIITIIRYLLQWAARTFQPNEKRKSVKSKSIFIKKCNVYLCQVYVMHTVQISMSLSHSVQMKPSSLCVCVQGNLKTIIIIFGPEYNDISSKSARFRSIRLLNCLVCLSVAASSCQRNLIQLQKRNIYTNGSQQLDSGRIDCPK